jgi:branched-chain amino acid transport system ATP-binding protein
MPKPSGAARERVAGSDTREAQATATVRAAAAAAALIAGPGWAAAIGAPAAWRRYLTLPSGLAPWMAIGLVLAGLGAALIGWRMPVRDRARLKSGQLYIPAGLIPGFLMALIGLIVVGTRDAKLAATVMPGVPLIAGWVIGLSARLAVSSCAADITPAAGGIVSAGALIGLIFAGHLALVARGSGVIRASGWTVVYAAFAAVNLIRSHRWLPHDRRNITSQTTTAAADVPATTPNQDSVFKLDSISKSFGPNDVLRSVSIQVAAGEMVALVGGNGAGKSTLLRIAAGLITADSGRVVVGTDDVTTLLPEERAAAGLAFVSGARPIFPDLTVVQNLRVAAFKSHLTAHSFNDATDAVLEIVPVLASRRKSRAGVLSGGEQRLLAVAQTLYRRPVLLLADELTLGLDAEARLAVLDLLRVLADQGVAVVTVDHDLVSLLPRSDRAALLAHGALQLEPKPTLLLSRRSDLLPATFLAGAGR